MDAEDRESSWIKVIYRAAPSSLIRLTFWRNIDHEFLGCVIERILYPLDSITIFQHLSLTTVSVCPIMGPFPRHHQHHIGIAPAQDTKEG